MYPVLLSTLVLLKIEPLDGFLHVDDNFVARFSSNPRSILRRKLIFSEQELFYVVTLLIS